MRENTHVEGLFALFRLGTAGRGRLIDHPSLVAEERRHLVEAGWLQYDQAVGQVEGLLGLAVGADVAVQVGAGEGDDQRSLGMAAAIAADGVVAAAGVDGDEGIAVLVRVALADQQAMAQALQQLRPALAGDAVALLRARRRRTCQEYLHARSSDPKKGSDPFNPGSWFFPIRRGLTPFSDRSVARNPYAVYSETGFGVREFPEIFFQGPMAMKGSLIFLAFLVLAGVQAVVHGEGKRRAMTIEDLFRFQRVSDPQLSPDGRYVVYVIGAVDMAANQT